MRKIFIIMDETPDIITGGTTNILIQLDHILHLEISKTGTMFFNTQYADYALRNADFSCDNSYEDCSDVNTAIVDFYRNKESAMAWSGNLTIEPREKQC